MPQSQEFNDLEKNEQEFTKLLAGFSEEDKTMLADVYRYAKEMHKGQKRDEGLDYIIHPLRASITLLRDVGVTDTAVIAGTLLHDVVEDTSGTLEDISGKYGDIVAGYVKDLTRERPENETEEQKRASKPAKFKWFIEDASVESARIKCADLLDNLRSWWTIPVGHKTEQKFPRWFGETLEWNLPLAQKADPKMVELFGVELDAFRADERFSQYFS